MPKLATRENHPLLSQESKKEVEMSELYINTKGFVSLGKISNTAGGIRWTEEIFLPWFDEESDSFMVNAWDGQTGPGNHTTTYSVKFSEVVEKLGKKVALAAKAKCYNYAGIPPYKR